MGFSPNYCCLYVLMYLYLTLYSHKKTSVPLTVFREKRGAYNALKQRKLTTWGVSLIWGLRKMKFICNAIFSIWYFFSYLVIMYTWINRIVYGEKCLPTNILRKVDLSRMRKYILSFKQPKHQSSIDSSKYLCHSKSHSVSLAIRLRSSKVVWY